LTFSKTDAIVVNIKHQEEVVMKKFILFSVFTFVTVFPAMAFSQSVSQFELQISSHKGQLTPRLYGFLQTNPFSKDKTEKSALNLFTFFQTGKYFNQAYVGTTGNLNSYLSSMLALGMTESGNIRGAVGYYFNYDFFYADTKVEWDLTGSEKIDTFFVQAKMYIDLGKSMSFGVMLQRFDGFGPLFNFYFGQHISFWVSPVMFDFETGETNLLSGVNFKM
jgi:hypothetical protein